MAFTTLLSPLLARGSLCEARELISRRWPISHLCDFAYSPNRRTAELALAALAIGGDPSAIARLEILLRRPCESIHRGAENALWCIWARSGSPQALHHLKRGSMHLKHENFLPATDEFSLAFSTDPTFSEALNQRAIAYFLSGRYNPAIRDCQTVIAMMPAHFGAWAGMGHCHIQLGQMQAARSCYCRALAIYPYMDGIQKSLADVESILGRAAPVA